MKNKGALRVAILHSRYDLAAHVLILATLQTKENEALHRRLKPHAQSTPKRKKHPHLTSPLKGEVR
jgi:hypothetical protein